MQIVLHQQLICFKENNTAKNKLYLQFYRNKSLIILCYVIACKVNHFKLEDFAMDDLELNLDSQLDYLPTSIPDDIFEVKRPKIDEDSVGSSQLSTKVTAVKRSLRIGSKKGLDRLNRVVPKRKYVRTKKVSSEAAITSQSIPKLTPYPNPGETSHLLPVVDILEKYNFKYEIIPDTPTHDCFYLQDKYMSAVFNYYPEFLVVDCLCEIHELELNVILFISVDSNGLCEVVSVGLVKTVDSGLLWLCEMFKKYNPQWHKLKLVVCDKKFKTYEAVKTAFPEKTILISFFHSIKTLKTDLNNLEGVSKQDISEVIPIFEQMVYCTNDTLYNDLFRRFKLLPATIVSYFKKTWHQRKDAWTIGQQLCSKQFFKALNCFLAQIRKEIRPLVNTQSCLENVIQPICAMIHKLRQDKFQNFVHLFETVPDKDLHIQKFSKHVTKFATGLIIEQYKDCSSVKGIRKLSCGKYICASEDIITLNACSCNFFQLFYLPCCHMFALRRHLSMPLFMEGIASSRWIKTNYQSTFFELQCVYASPTDIQNYGTGNYQQIVNECEKLWDCLQQSSESQFPLRLHELNTLLSAWRNGIRVKLDTMETPELPVQGVPTLPNVSDNDWEEAYGISLDDFLQSDNEIESCDSSDILEM